ncbi:hypothetical protein B0A48_02738 [Cryoendolithus antarcticus]|uniref:Trafficking protein particle complex II-specific subunit 65 IgD3 domain-containing protein n=1 Tax=Cryoendolithus antarcticus TaxID=1507870 RepID=A0A1V8TL46_9PEZI|nr:hypothetical protein B0A48_02738 [Cryoendolithus antarcticus]
MSKAIDVRADFAALSKKAYLEVLVPKDDTFDAATVLRNGSPEELQRAVARKQLYFDERSKLQIVLKTALPQIVLEALLPFLELTIAAHATTADPAAASNPAISSAKHDVASTKHNASDSNVQVLTIGDSTYAVWKQPLHLAQPGSKVRRPAVYFTANLSPLADALAEASIVEKDYLPSFQPLPANVLEPLRFDASYGDAGREIYLSETRVAKVSPTAPRLEPLMRPLRGATKRAFPISSALYTRFGYSPVPQGGVVSVHVEAAKLISGDVQVHDVEMMVPGYDVGLLNSVDWPQQIKGGDEVVLLFHVLHTSMTIGSKEDKPPSLKLDAIMNIEDGTSVQLYMNRMADIKLPAATADKVYCWTNTKLSSDPVLSSGNRVGRPGMDIEGKNEVIFNFTGPAEVKLNADFVVHVQCVNKSDRARKLALRPTPAKETAQGNAQFPARGSSKAGSDTRTMSTGAISPRTASEPHVLVVTPDIPTETLAPGACCEVDLQYRAVRAGSLQLGMVRIVDLQSEQRIVVSDLPDVVAID